MNPFFISNKEPDNALRPYTGGIREHENSIATIVLYDGNFGQIQKAAEINYNDSKNKTEVKPISVNVDYEDIEKSADRINGSIPNLGELLANRTSYADFKTTYGAYLGIFNNFSLMRVEETKDQIAKIHQNFGSSWNMFFFGATPSMYSFSGIFLDTSDYPYYHEFMFMYDHFLSGQKCVENGFKMKIMYDGKIIGGYLLRIRTITTADSPHTKTFSFSVVVTDEEFMRQNMAVINDGSGTNGLGFNIMNNSHRVVRQYPMLLNQQQAKALSNP